MADNHPIVGHSNMADHSSKGISGIPFAICQQSSDVIEPDMNTITCFTCKKYILEFNSRKFR